MSLNLKCEVSTVVNELYSSGEKVVSMSGCAGFDGPESSTGEERLEEFRTSGVSCYFASRLQQTFRYIPFCKNNDRLFSL